MGTGATGNSAAKLDRFNIRTTVRDKDLVTQAAYVARMSTSQFVMQAALRSAEEILADQSRFVVPPEKWDAFVDALDRPAREVPALKKAVSKPNPFSDR